MFDSLINYLDKFGPEVLVIQAGFLVILSTLFLFLWFSNRRKYHNLKHAIPAAVVKNYLDSIIQNSTALKSSLFRGGGLDAGAGSLSIPSVMPLSHLGGGESVALSGAPSTALLEDLNQKKAIIASLEAQLSALQSANKELETKTNLTEQKLAQAEARIKELEALLAEARKGGAGADQSLQTELTMVTRERDEIRDRLKEFEIIADDLANLKRLQQENEQLKRSLAAQGGSLPPQPQAASPEPKRAPQADVSDLLSDLGSNEPSSDDNSALEEFLSASTPDAEEASPVQEFEDSAEEPAAEVAAADASPEDEPQKPKSEKTPEDLLSEFEKMLG